MSPRTRHDALVAAQVAGALLLTSTTVARDYVGHLSATAWQALNVDPFAQRTHALRHIARTAAERLEAHGGAR